MIMHPNNKPLKGRTGTLIRDLNRIFEDIERKRHIAEVEKLKRKFVETSNLTRIMVANPNMPYYHSYIREKKDK